MAIELGVDTTLAFGIVASILILQSIYSAVFSKDVKAPQVGARWFWEPSFFTRHRFTRSAFQMVNDGYKKFKDSKWIVLRPDRDVLFLSNKYIDELRNVPEDTLSPLQAHVDALLGHHTGVDQLLGSNLHTRMLQTKLTPRLNYFLPSIRRELLYGMKIDFPPSKDWEPVQVSKVLVRLVARISAKLFVSTLCRNDEWLDVSVSYSENVFKTVIPMRLFPKWLHPVVGVIVPTWWQVKRDLKLAQRLIIPLVEQRRKAEAAGDPGYEKPDDLLQWMMDGANETESSPSKLARRQLLLTLASIHTTTMAVTHALFDLAAMPEYLAPLREEIDQVLEEEGGWQGSALGKMRKIDSFLKESQRLNPPSIMSFNRVVYKDMTLTDGTKLPQGTKFAMPAGPLVFDDDLVENAREFDGFRYYKKRQQPGESGRHQFAMTDANSLHFGHGKYACPGRFLASNEIKTMLAHILTEYDFKLIPGQARPQNQFINEYIFPDPNGQLLFRERQAQEPANRVPA